MYLHVYIYVYTHVHMYTEGRRERGGRERETDRENLIKPDLYFITFNFWNDKFKSKVIRITYLLACTCDDIFWFKYAVSQGLGRHFQVNFQEEISFK